MKSGITQPKVEHTRILSQFPVLISCHNLSSPHGGLFIVANWVMSQLLVCRTYSRLTCSYHCTLSIFHFLLSGPSFYTFKYSAILHSLGHILWSAHLWSAFGDHPSRQQIEWMQDARLPWCHVPQKKWDVENGACRVNATTRFTNTIYPQPVYKHYRDKWLAVTVSRTPTKSGQVFYAKGYGAVKGGL